MLKKYTVIILFILSALSVRGQQQQPDPEKGLVHWLTIEEAMTQYKQIQKPILIDFYTNWCGWCKHMMKTTYSDQNLAAYINTYFYPVKFNAEGKDTVEFLGKSYGPTEGGAKAPHELAIELMGGSMSYPTTVFLSAFDANTNKFNLDLRAPGFLDNLKIEPLLVFTVENAFRNSNYDDFSAGFETCFRDSTVEARISKMNWEMPAQAFADAGNKKKSIVLINTGWCNTCKVMKRASFTDDAVMSYADSTFRLIDFDAEFADPISFQGYTYQNPKTQQMPFHQLAMALCKNNLVLPSIAILDEENKLIDAIPFYLPGTLLSKVLHYYGDDVYKTKSWQEFASNP